MTVVAIHQPNYIPWLGYFYKMSQADVFIFLDNVQFSKQGYTNRAQILATRGARWLSQPVSVTLGDLINVVRPARSDWVRSHLDTLRGAYNGAAEFKSVWSDICALYEGLPETNLAAINGTIIARLATLLDITTELRASSGFDTGDLEGDERLVALVTQVDPCGIYLSGRGGAKYQDSEKFRKVGIELTYSNFEHPTFDQGHSEFKTGLSLLDAVFHLGWEGAAGLLRP